MSHTKLMIGGLYMQEKLMNPVLKGEMRVQSGENLTPKESSPEPFCSELTKAKGCQKMTKHYRNPPIPKANAQTTDI